ncbi:DUF6950 family protein [Marinibacterium sp. SX1]|uniref:DUF6950 family protein n=1 Tax=Marinibacterium sp. SX1 TaxID=3388424 RepID=UPI003D167CB5
MTYWDLAERVMLRPHRWGFSDCVMSVAAIWGVLRGAHPAPEMIGAYHDARAARALVTRLGGLPCLLRARAAAGGLEPANDAIAGAVGFVPSGGIGALAFCPEDGVWVAKSLRGMALGIAVDRGAGAWVLR